MATVGKKDFNRVRGDTWDIGLFTFKNLDLTAAQVRIQIRSAAGVFLDSNTHGTVSLTLAGADTKLNWQIPYALTEAASPHIVYEYDAQFTYGGVRKTWIKGLVNVTNDSTP